MIRSARGSSALLALSLMVGAVRARSDDATVAETLFQEGKKLMQAGKYAEACPKLAESQRLDPGGGTLLALGLCHEGEGKTASAWTELNEALAMATKDGRTERVKTAKAHLAAIEPRLSRLTMKVPAADEVNGFVLSLDGSTLPKEAWSSAIPVDPGSHAIVARAPGKKAWSSTILVAEGAQPVVEIAILAADEGPSAPIEPKKTSGTQKTIGWVTIGTGAVGFGVGAVFGYRALAKRKDSDHQCPTDTTCTPEGKSFNDQAKTAAWISDVGFGAAIVAGVIGTYLVLSAPKSETAVHVAPAVSTTSAGFALSCAF